MADPQATSKKLLWLDADPGHDDAIAILLALHEPSIELLGVSTVHGNAGLNHTSINAARLLEAFGAPAHIKVYPGSAKPLIGLPHPAVDIHGNDGLGGVEGLPDASEPNVKARIVNTSDPAYQHALPAVIGIRNAAIKALEQGRRLHLGVTGACTNVAIFLTMYPVLAVQAVEKIVCMGGGVGIGNITASAEFNIYIDPEAAQIVFDSGIPVYCVPLNVTHQCLFHEDALRHLLDPTLPPASASSPLPPAATPLRYTLSTLMTFFAKTYRDVFGFQDGPPIHDALVVAYIARPELFKSTLCRVDVERSGDHSRGALIVDTHNRKPGQKLNVEMSQSLDVSAVLRTFFVAFERADHASPLNSGTGYIPQDIRIPDVAVRVGTAPPM